MALPRINLEDPWPSGDREESSHMTFLSVSLNYTEFTLSAARPPRGEGGVAIDGTCLDIIAKARWQKANT